MLVYGVDWKKHRVRLRFTLVPSIVHVFLYLCAFVRLLLGGQMHSDRGAIDCTQASER